MDPAQEPDAEFKSNGQKCIGGAFIFVVLAFLFALMLAPETKMGDSKRFATLHDSKLGSFYVVGRYSGFLGGWSIAFFHIDATGEWDRFYLAHESDGWIDANLELNAGRVIIRRKKTVYADFDLETGTLNHRRGVVYPRPEGQQSLPPEWWGISTSSKSTVR